MACNPPPWAKAPTTTEEPRWTLTEIKDGVEVDRHDVHSRAYTLFGRDADQSHVVLGHESCSRIHARLAFDSNGTCWFRDLGSTHGSKLNKKNLPPASIGKHESNSTKPGSRGVVIYPGDIIHFGASTRMYCLEGPESFSRANAELAKKLPPSVTESGKVKSLPSVDEQDDIDADLLKLPTKLTEQDVPERWRKEFSALRSLRYKLEHVKEESQRIQRKGMLTETQEKQLEINDDRAEKLHLEIEAKEASLYRKLFPEKIQRRKEKEEEKLAFFDDGEVEDRTKAAKRSIGDEAETEETLLKKRDQLLLERATLEKEIQSHARQTDELKDRVRQMQSRGDEDTFFVENDLQIVSDIIEKERSKLKEICSLLDEVDSLLKVVNPNLSLLKRPLDEDDFAVPLPKKANTKMLPPPPKEDSVAMLPPPVVSKKTSGASDKKHPRVHGPIMPPPSPSTPYKEVRGTAGVMSSLLGMHPEPKESTSSETPQGKGNELTKPATVKTDEKHDNWRPPKDQDGSGYTKLNAKFAGRY